MFRAASFDFVSTTTDRNWKLTKVTSICMTADFGGAQQGIECHAACIKSPGMGSRGFCGTKPSGRAFCSACMGSFVRACSMPFWNAGRLPRCCKYFCKPCACSCSECARSDVFLQLLLRWLLQPKLSTLFWPCEWQLQTPTMLPKLMSLQPCNSQNRAGFETL